MAQPALPAYRVPVFGALAVRPGIDLHVVYGNEPGGPANVAPSGFDGTFVPLRRLGRPSLLWYPRHWQSTVLQGAQVLLLPWNIRYVDLVPVLLRARAEGVATVLWGHGYSKREGWLRARLRDRITSLATAVLFYSEGRARQFLSRRGGPPERVHVAPNALDQAPVGAARAHWLARPRALAEFQAARGLAGRKVVLFVSRLARENRVDMLVRALPALRARVPESMAVIVGNGDDRQRLSELTTGLGLDGHVLFVDASYDELELAPWFMSASVFCYPENAGLSLLHAFGYGLPVVVSDRIEHHNPEIEAVRAGANGLFYRHANAEALAEALRTLFCDEPLRARMSAEAARTAEKVYTVQRMVDGIEGAVRYAAAAVGRGGASESPEDLPRRRRA